MLLSSVKLTEYQVPSTLNVKLKANGIILELGQTNSICNQIYIANIPEFKRVQSLGLAQSITELGANCGFWIWIEVRNTAKMQRC